MSYALAVMFIFFNHFSASADLVRMCSSTAMTKGLDSNWPRTSLKSRICTVLSCPSKPKPVRALSENSLRASFHSIWSSSTTESFHFLIISDRRAGVISLFSSMPQKSSIMRYAHCHSRSQQFWCRAASSALTSSSEAILPFCILSSRGMSSFLGAISPQRSTQSPVASSDVGRKSSSLPSTFSKREMTLLPRNLFIAIVYRLMPFSMALPVMRALWQAYVSDVAPEISFNCFRVFSPRSIFCMVQGESRLKLTLSSRPSGDLLSRLGHFCASRMVPTLRRATAGARYVTPSFSIRQLKGMSEVSGLVVWRPITREKAPMRAGHRMQESLAVLAPRSIAPWCIGPSLYMWLLWLLPLPAFMNENMPAMSNVLL